MDRFASFERIDQPDPFPEGWDELDYIHPSCGFSYSDHPTVQRFDANGNDYEINECPKEAQ